MGHITKFTGPVSVVVQSEDGSLVKRYFDEICKKLTRTFENILSDSEQAEGTSAFVSYPAVNSTPHSETNTGTTSTESQPTNSNITTETAEIPVFHPSAVPNSTSASVRRNPS